MSKQSDLEVKGFFLFVFIRNLVDTFNLTKSDADLGISAAQLQCLGIGNLLLFL